VISRERTHSTFLLCFTCFERMPSNKVDFMGAPHLTFLLRFTRFERMPSNKSDFTGAHTFNVSVVFYML
jgi:hypothetical protein